MGLRNILRLKFPHLKLRDCKVYVTEYRSQNCCPELLLTARRCSGWIEATPTLTRHMFLLTTAECSSKDSTNEIFATRKRSENRLFGTWLCNIDAYKKGMNPKYCCGGDARTSTPAEFAWNLCPCILRVYDMLRRKHRSGPERYEDVP